MLKTGGDAAARFALLFHAIGLATTLGVHRLARHLGVDPLRAGVWAALWAASPSAVLYEHWLFYTQAVAALLVGGALAAHAFARRGAARHALLFSGVLAALACTRSLFHLAWALALAGGALWLAGPSRDAASLRRAAIAMAPALLAIALLYAKNAVLFDSAAASTWLGMSLAKVSTWRLPADEREALVERGELSRAALVKPFSPLHHYPREMVAGPPGGHPALDRIVKPGNYTNFNHVGYARLSRPTLDDALHVIRTRPQVWLESVALAALRYAIPPSQYGFVAANAAAYAPVDRVYQVVEGVPEAWTGRRAEPALQDPAYLLRRVRWLYWAAAAFGVGWALVRIRAGADAPERAALLWCVANVAWVAVVANAVELGENQRFQVMVAPLHWVLIAASLDATWRGKTDRTETEETSDG